MNREELLSQVNKLAQKQPWFHYFKLSDGIETRPPCHNSAASNTSKWMRIEPLLKTFDVKGKRVLDVGCAEGFFSLQMAKMGSSGLGIDIDPCCIEKALFVKRALDINTVDFKQMDVYSEHFNNQPSFDLALCLGFLHRISDPYTAITHLVQHSDTILFEWKTLRHPLVQGPYAYMKPIPVDKNNPYGTRYWSLSYECLEWILTRHGYRYFRRIQNEHTSRAILIAGRVDNSVFTPEKGDIVRKNRFGKVASQTKHYLRLVGKTLFQS